jgi:hypothetical protein
MGSLLGDRKKPLSALLGQKTQPAFFLVVKTVGSTFSYYK